MCSLLICFGLLIHANLGRRVAFVPQTAPLRAARSIARTPVVGLSMRTPVATAKQTPQGVRRGDRESDRGAEAYAKEDIVHQTAHAFVQMGHLPKNGAKAHVRQLIAMLVDGASNGNRLASTMLAKLESLSLQHANLETSQLGQDSRLEKVKKELRDLHHELLAGFCSACKIGRRDVLFGTSSLVASLLAPRPVHASYALSQANSVKVTKVPTILEQRLQERELLGELSDEYVNRYPKRKKPTGRTPKYCAGEQSAVQPQLLNMCETYGLSKADQSNNNRANAVGNYDIGSGMR